MSQSSNLYRLQQIDSPIDQKRARIHEIEVILGNNAILAQAEEYVKSTGQSYQESRKSLQKAEDTVQDQRVKISQAESTLYGGKVRNPKELQDLQNDVAALKRFLGVLEDRQLEEMLALEDAEHIHKQAIINLNEIQAKISEEQAELRGELSQLLTAIERLEVERQVAASDVNPTDLELYEQLRQSRKRIAVAKVSSQACGACGTLLTPALVQAAHSSSNLIRCTTCGRILYVG